MFGYMNATEAKAQGFTHHGKYFGIPIWIENPHREGCMVAAKWAPMDYLFDLFTVIEGVLLSVFFPDREPAFQLRVGARIEESSHG